MKRKTEILFCSINRAVFKIMDSRFGPLSMFTKPSVRNLGDLVISRDLVISTQLFTLNVYAKFLVGSCFYHLRNIIKLSSIASWA